MGPDTIPPRDAKGIAVHIEMNARFRDEARRFDLRFCCEDCANWHPDREACSILYPSEPHRRTHVDQLEDGERLYFCKMYEPR